MPLDADIAAADPATLEKIKAQDYRDSLKASTAREAARLAAYQADVASMTKFRADQMALMREQAALLPASEPELTLRQRMGLAIAEKYMTTSTSTVPATVLADAVNDAARLRAAIDEALKALAP
jgi:hypothetical protein